MGEPLPATSIIEPALFRKISDLKVSILQRSSVLLCRTRTAALALHLKPIYHPKSAWISPQVCVTTTPSLRTKRHDPPQVSGAASPSLRRASCKRLNFLDTGCEAITPSLQCRVPGHSEQPSPCPSEGPSKGLHHAIVSAYDHRVRRGADVMGQMRTRAMQHWVRCTSGYKTKQPLK